jgi:hypothetical protein
MSDFYEWAGGRDAFDRMINALCAAWSRTTCFRLSSLAACMKSIAAMSPHGGTTSEMAPRMLFARQ